MGIELAYGFGAALLLAALIWGTMRYRQRSSAQKSATDAATRRLYDKPKV
jgi:hypothetical protein